MLINDREEIFHSRRCRLCIYNNDINVLPNVFYAPHVKPILSLRSHILMSHLSFHHIFPVSRSASALAFSFREAREINFLLPRKKKRKKEGKKVVKSRDGINRMVHGFELSHVSSAMFGTCESVPERDGTRRMK
jgi:hypothetical protein